MAEERALFPGNGPVPLHVPPHLVRSFDFWRDLADRPQERISRLHEGPRIFYSPDLHHPLRKAPGAWVVTRAADVRTVFGTPEIFSSQEYDSFASSIGEHWLLTPLEVDPPAHGKYRTLINPIFSPKRMVELEPQIRSWAIELIDAIAARGSCEFIGDFAKHFPTGIFIDMMGLPRNLLDRFVDWENRLLNGTSAQERLGALREILDYLRETIQARRAQPSDDVIGTIVRSEIDGRPLTDDEIVGITILLYSAGLDTVVNSLGFIFRFLAENPDLQALLRADSKAIPRHVEEMMRLFSPVTPQRIAVQDTELGGVQIKAGDLVTVSLAAASRDPEDIPDPARFDPQRNPNPHFGFGYGVHRCVGAQLARRDISIAIEEWLKRIPDFRIAPDAQIKAVGGSVLALDQLPLVW